MDAGVEGTNLLGEALDQLARCAYRDGGNVVDRLVRIQLGALAADLGQRIDDVRTDTEQTELENLK
jgi:hypothetical protein